MIRGEIYFGDITITLSKAKKQRGTNKVIDIDRHDYKMNRLVFTTHEGKIVLDAGHVKHRIQRNLPKHLQGHEITSVTLIGGEKIGETSYDISPFIK